MDTLNARQLGFLLKIGVDDARRTMIAAYCKEQNVEVASWSSTSPKQEYHKDDYPETVKIELLSRHLNIPNLQQVVDEITNNYLTRKSSRGYILGYPLKVIEKKQDKGIIKVSIPSVVKSFLPDHTIAEIIRLWKERYSHFKNVQFD
jgi:hypothetical protein